MKTREIKFRAWNSKTKEFEYFELHNITVPDRLLCQHDYPVQQFTGLKDKDDKEIYEGDLIECPQYVKSESFSNPLIVTGEVKWDDKEGCWSAYPACSETNYNLYKANSEKIEIVGNIFEK